MGATISGPKKIAYLKYILLWHGRISEREIARRLNIGKTTVNRWAKELGLRCTSFSVDETFFDEWSPEMAYVLGFIYADGNVVYDPDDSRWTLTIHLSKKDIAHLRRIKQLLRSTKPLDRRSETNSVRMQATDRYLVERLIELGVVPAKSTVLAWPDALPEEYMRDFIRGYVDGDGCVYACRRERSPYFKICICSGSEDFLNGLVDAIRLFAGVPGNAKPIRKNLYRVEYSCARGERLAKWLYEGARIFLKRKRRLYDSFRKEHREYDKN